MVLWHDIPSADHQGVARTTERVKQSYFFRGITRDVEVYVVSCSTCSVSKKPNRAARHPMVLHHAGAPMERVHLDFEGPLPKTERGSGYVFMIIDHFNKWVECIPSPPRVQKSLSGQLSMSSSHDLDVPSKFSPTRGGTLTATFFDQCVSCSTSINPAPPPIGLPPKVRCRDAILVSCRYVKGLLAEGLSNPVVECDVLFS